DPDLLKDALERLDVRRVIVDPERAERATSLGFEVLVLGGGDRTAPSSGRNGPRVRDLEAIDPATVPLPADLERDPGRARDVANVLLRPVDDDGTLRTVPITNHRWALSALGAAAACTIKPGDTVFCAVPLHHPTGMLVSVGAALVGGARLALTDLEHAPLDARDLLLEIRRTGATVLFYAGEMLRRLLDEPISRADRHLPVRIFAGSGMRPALAARLREKFGVDTMEFYAGTAHRAILADAAGDEPGSLGRVLPGSADVTLVKCDLLKRSRVLDALGHLVVADSNRPALLAVRVSDEEIETLGDTRGLVRDAFGDGASWLVTGDVIERDSTGRHWFVDSVGGFVATRSGKAASLRGVEDALYALPEAQLAAAWDRGDGKLGAAFVSRAEITTARIDEAMAALPEHARPAFIARVAKMPLTDGFRPNRRAAIANASTSHERWKLDVDRYVPA
ncbi:MAG: Polyhydroxyalkanoic acid synthase, partial [Labilithrix sp.]|nr:Polyhydroxyalkanoic acid synthase [Labilithrix sp.]